MIGNMAYSGKIPEGVKLNLSNYYYYSDETLVP
jgi:hypothetical protein